MKIIAESPSPEMYRSGLEIDCQCARCGSSVDTERCNECEDGLDGHDCGEDCCACLHPEDNVPCQYCDGSGVFHCCMSSPEFCRANPLPGREDVEPGRIEWFTIDRGDGGQNS
jgi:hypothetical protein